MYRRMNLQVTASEPLYVLLPQRIPRSEEKKDFLLLTEGDRDLLTNSHLLGSRNIANDVPCTMSVDRLPASWSKESTPASSRARVCV